MKKEKYILITGELMPYTGQKYSKDPTKGGKPIGYTLGTIKISKTELIIIFNKEWAK